MATATLDSDSVLIKLSTAEKVLGLRIRDLRLPLSTVRDVRIREDGLRAAVGLRAPGLAIPRRVKIGTWRRDGGRTFVSVRRGAPALRIDFEGAAWDAVLVSTAAARALGDEVRERAGTAGGARTREVSIAAEDVQLVGTLRLPTGKGPHPAAVLAPGSGPLDRDSNHRRAPIGVGRDLAEALAGCGIASLRYDRRGVAASGGSFLATGFHDNARDLAAALRALREQPDVDRTKCFLIGHSEGALLATVVAADDRDLAGVVLLAGAAKTGEETLAWQTRRIAPTLPAPVRLLLRTLRFDLVRRQAKNVERLRGTSGDVERIGGRKVNARWHREFIAFDPEPALASVTAPVLALTGDKDIQVDPADLDVIARTVHARVDVERVPELTHVLRRDSAAPSLSRYRKLLRRPTDPGVLARVCAWVTERARDPR